MAIPGLALLILGVGMLAGTGGLLAASLRPAGAISFLLASLAIAWAVLVALVLALSPPGLVTRDWLLAGEAIVLAGALVAWRRVGAPRPPLLAAPVRIALGELRDPVLGVLAATIAAATAYIVALAFFTPVLEWDSLAYHLPRVMFWIQQEAVAYIPNASDPRLDGNPPGAEIGVLATMLWSGSDRYVALPQLAALAMLVLAIAGIARRIGLSHAQALFGALLFSGLPLVAVQAPTTYNDLVVAGFLTACAYALLGRTRLDLVLVALSLGLALTTKLTAVIALPLLALLGLAAQPARRLVALAAAGAAGVALGAPWYLVNLVETGHADGGLTTETAQDQELSLLAVAPTIRRYLYSFIDFSGSRDIGTFTLYAGAAAVVAAGGIVLGLVRGRVRRTWLVALGAAAVVAVPLALVEIARGLLHMWFKFWLVVGRRDIAEADPSWQVQDGSDAALSWFGPSAAALLVLAPALVLFDVAQRRLPRTTVALALAPVGLIVVFALLVPWDPWRGRFLVFAVALAAATWGVTLARRPVAWGVVALTAVALPLTLLAMYTKPSSAPYVHGHQDPSIWTDSEDEVFDDLYIEEEVIHAARVVDGRRTATVALAPRENDFLYPFFGRRQQNVVKLVSIAGGRVPDDADWLVLAPGARVVRCGAWRQELETGGWRVSRRTTTATAPCERATGGAAA